jgi:hypothetical protein
MRKIFFGIIVFFVFQVTYAQEPVKPSLQVKDSVRMKTSLFYEPGLDIPDIKEDILPIPEIQLKLDIPVFDFSRYLNSRWKVSYSSFSKEFQGFGMTGFSYAGSFFNPFGVNGAVFNQAIYQVSDKIKIGGNSFGMNSIPASPLNYPGSGRYNIRGASIFMEYKVSKNIRIGGGVSVSGNPYQP